MDCETTRRRLQAALEGDPLPATAEAHLAACGACAEWRATLLDVHGALAEEPALEWTPAMTATVALAVRRNRVRDRRFAAATAAALLPAAWLGLQVLGNVEVVREAGAAATGSLPASAPGAIADLTGSLSAVAADATAALGSFSFGAGTPLALAGVALLLILNTLAVGRLSR